MGGFLGALGQLGQFGAAAIVPATNVIAADNQADANSNQLKLQQAIQRAQMARQAENDRVSNNLKSAQATALQNQWVIYKTDENGNIVALPKKLPMNGMNAAPSGSTSPTTPPPSDPAFSAPTSDQWNGALKGVPAVASDTTPPKPIAPPVTPSPASPTIGLQTGIKGLTRPTPHLDPNSPEGIAAAATRAAAVAAARAPYMSQKVDPNSAAAITADSTKAANRALARPGGMTGGMGSGGIGGLARTSGGITEMGQADQMMTPYENAVKNKTANYNGLDYFQGMLSKMYDAHGTVNQAVHSATFANLDKTNPDLANYLRAAELWALADGTVSGRTSDFRTKLDGFVSAIGPNAGPQQVDNTQRARSTRLQALQKFQPAMEAAASRFVPGGKPGAPANAAPSVPPAVANPDNKPGNINLGAPTKEQALWDAAVKLHGQAKVLQEYGPRPGGEE